MSESKRSCTTAVLLAAGAGTRLGLGAKSLLPFRGRTLVEVITDILLDGGCQEVVVVLGAAADRVLASTRLGIISAEKVRVVVNPDWRSGMASSFRLGVETASPGHDVMVALVDQPRLAVKAVRTLLARHRPGRVTAAAYPDGSGGLRRGHPLLLDASLRSLAAEIAMGDCGARLFLQNNPGLVDLVGFSEQFGGEDLDTPDQLYLLD